MGKTKNYRLSEDEKRIHREAVELRKKTDKQLIEYIEGEKASIRESLLAEYKAVFDEYIYPVFECVDETFSGCPEDFRRCLKAMDIAGSVIGDCKAESKADGYFRDTGAKRLFLRKLSEIPGIGKAIMKRIEGAAADGK